MYAAVAPSGQIAGNVIADAHRVSLDCIECAECRFYRQKNTVNDQKIKVLSIT
jgi:hypothetical protein